MNPLTASSSPLPPIMARLFDQGSPPSPAEATDLIGELRREIPKLMGVDPELNV